MARRASSPDDGDRPLAARGDRPSPTGDLRRPILCAVLDGEAFAAAPRERALRLFEAGVDWIQLRDRTLAGRRLLALAEALVAARDQANGARPGGDDRASLAWPDRRVLVNKRADVALAAAADGVHLGGDALTAVELRALAARSPGSEGRAPAGATWLVGASLHSVAELEQQVAAHAPLDYVQLAPIWDPRSKPAERPALGLDALARAARRATAAGWRLFAQGGLDPTRAGQAIAAGASGIAVTGVVGLTDDPVGAARGLRDALDRARR